MNPAESYYDEHVQYEWERMQRHPTEFAVTLRALADYLPLPPATILDIGSGPGRYALELARRRYAVTLFDLSASCLEFAQIKAQEARVQLQACVHGTATDLKPFEDESFDAVLLMGPLYHLLTLQERQRAVQEARRVLRPGGVIAASSVTRYAPIRYAAKNDPDWLEVHQSECTHLLATGLAAAELGTTWFACTYFAHPAEFVPLMEGQGFETRTLVACEGVVSLIEERISSLSGELWEAWVDLNYRLGRDASVHGAAEHLLYVGVKG